MLALLLLVILVALAPLGALAARAVQRREPETQYFAEYCAVIFLWVTMDASLLTTWGLHAGELAEIHQDHLWVLLLVQPFIPWFCYTRIILPARFESLAWRARSALLANKERGVG